MARRRRTEPYPIDIRDERVRPRGRLTLSSRTTDAATFRRREAAVRALIDRGEWDVLDRLRARRLRIEDVQSAFEAGNVARLRSSTTPTATLDSLRLADVLARQLQRVDATLQPGTAKEYRSLESHLVGRWGDDFDISTLRTAEAEAFLREPKPKTRTGGPWSAGQQSKVRAMAGGFWRREIERELEMAERTGLAPRMTRNPWTAAEVPEAVKTRYGWLRPGEWAELREYLRQHHPERLVVFAAGVLAGLRLGEILHLRPGLDVDLDAGVLRIQARKGEHPWRPKNPKRGTRDVPIGAELRSALAYHLEHFAGRRYLVIVPGRDRPVSQPLIQGWTQDAFEAVGLTYGQHGEDSLTFHNTRHTFASWLAQRRYTTKEIAELIGDTEKMVSETYSHLGPNNKREAVEALSFLGANPGPVSGALSGETGDGGKTSRHDAGVSRTRRFAEPNPQPTKNADSVKENGRPAPDGSGENSPFPGSVSGALSGDGHPTPSRTPAPRTPRRRP